jgi:hypothetical protein
VQALPIQIMKVLTTVWYNHTYSFVPKTYPKDRDSPQVVLRVYFAVEAGRVGARLCTSRGGAGCEPEHCFHQRLP